MVMQIAILVAGIGVGWILSWLVVVNPLVRLLAEMRQLGFVPTTSKRRSKPQADGPNET